MRVIKRYIEKFLKRKDDISEKKTIGENQIKENIYDDDMPTMRGDSIDSEVTVAISHVAKGHIEGQSGIYEGADISIPPNEEIIIGRDKNCAHLVLDFETVSRKHCGIRFNSKAGIYIVTDYSKNGVFYKNGQPFPKNTATVCKAGTVIEIEKSGNVFILK